MIEFRHGPGIVELIPDLIILKARDLCLRECRAGICQAAGWCLNAWPGESAGFGDMISDAYRAAGTKPRYRVKAKGRRV